MTASKTSQFFFPHERLQRLTDIIFAVSIVIFIVTGMFSIKDASFFKGYMDDPSKFATERGYELVISFIVFLFMALYWYNNVRLSKYLVKTNATFIWINIVYLFFIAVAPLPNALSIQYSRNFFVQLFFGIIMFFIGSLAFISWYYASNKYRLVCPDLPLKDIRAIDREFAVEPMVAVLAIIATFIDTALWEWVLYLLPVGMIAVYLMNGRIKRVPERKPGDPMKS